MNNNILSRVIRIIALSLAAIALIILLGLTLRSTGCFTIVWGASMEPTLHSGQIILGMPVRLNPAQEVHRGDIVTLSTQSGTTIIKRVIAIPGDTLEIRNDQIYLNGMALQEDYIAEPMHTRDIPAFTLAEDQYFVLGDNRNISADSRCYGLFSRSDMIGVIQPQFHVLPVLLFLLVIFIFARCLSSLMDKVEDALATSTDAAHHPAQAPATANT